MNTDELLAQIGKLLEAEREYNKKLVHEEVQVAKQEIMGAIEKEAETMAEFFHETWQKMEATNEQVSIIEDHLGIADPNKN